MFLLFHLIKTIFFFRDVYDIHVPSLSTPGLGTGISRVTGGVCEGPEPSGRGEVCKGSSSCEATVLYFVTFPLSVGPERPQDNHTP